MRSKTPYLYFSVFCIHSTIALLTFTAFFQHPGSLFFSQWDDGVKNMFTQFTYVKEPLTAEGIMKYNSFCYPFGDYVFYTDNTPLFSVPFRWFCLHVTDLSRYTIIIFQLVIISNIILCGLLAFYIFRWILKENTFSFILGIVLPWTNVQVLRILRGHFNLSFSSFILLAICLLLLWHKHRSEPAKRWLILAGMTILSVFSFLAHVYYLPIITIFIAAALFFYGLITKAEPYGKFTLVSSFAYPVVAVGLSFLILYGVDKNYALRSVTANGYDWMEQKTRFTSLLNHYYFQRIYLPIPTGTGQVDKPGYLGNIGLVALLVISCLATLSKRHRGKIMQLQRDFFRDPLKAALVTASVVMLMISFGEVYYTGSEPGSGLKLINIFNPFLYLHLLTDRVEQFRFLERFMWPFYFGFYIWIAYTILGLSADAGKRLRGGIVVFVLFLGGIEVYDFTKEIKRQLIMENCLNMDYVKKFIPAGIVPGEFQAILPIPYYFTGAEDSVYDYNIDGDPDWVMQTYSIASGTGLPLMSSNMSRSPRVFGEMLLNFVANDSMDLRLVKKLNNKPVLIAVNKNLVNNREARGIPATRLNAELYWKATGFAQRNHLQAFDSVDNVVFYKWYPDSRLH